MGQYISAEDAATRYANLAEFARRYGHYYISNGPYFLSGVFPVEGQAVLSQYAAHPDSADRFSAFGAPAFPEVEIDGERVEAGFYEGANLRGAMLIGADLDGLILHGIEAPPPEFLCEGKVTLWPCGAHAKTALGSLVDGRRLRCTIRHETSGGERQATCRLDSVDIEIGRAHV